MDQALAVGSRILDGQYCLTRLLYQRPRVNLYLGRRLPSTRQHETGAAGETRRRRDEPLVAIRELVLTGLPAKVRARVEQAAWEEFVSPGVVSSLHLSGTGERMWLRSEHERHYLLMQLHAGNEAHIPRIPHVPHTITTLADVLQQQRWPQWLNVQTSLAWGIQLCRIVARLHRLGTILGDLDPATVLVDQHGITTWSPLLLVFWPPSPQYWTAPSRGRVEFGRRVEDGRRVEASSTPTGHEYVVQYFPIASPSLESAFVAPELAAGTYDGRADVYALGAMLYLLLTGYAPASATRRCLLDGYTSDSHNTSNNVGAQFRASRKRQSKPQKRAGNGMIRRGEGGWDGQGGPLWSPVGGVSLPNEPVQAGERATIKSLPTPLHHPRPYGSSPPLRSVDASRKQFIAPAVPGHEANGTAAVIEGLELIPPRLLSPHIPSVLENILLCSLALDPIERYPSVFALIEALETAQESQECVPVARKAFRWTDAFR